MKLLSCVALYTAAAGGVLACEPELAVTRIAPNSFTVTLSSKVACDVSGLKLEIGGLTASDRIVPEPSLAPITHSEKGLILSEAIRPSDERGLVRFTRSERKYAIGASATSSQNALTDQLLDTTLFTITGEDALPDRLAPKFIHANAISSSGAPVNILVSEANTWIDSDQMPIGSGPATERRSVWIGEDFDPAAILELRSSVGIRVGSKPLANAQSVSVSSTQTICGGLPPAGWITIFINGTCSVMGNNSYISRTIQRIDSLPGRSTLNVCGDVPPSGWVTVSVNGNCKYVGFTGFIGRTIERIDSLPGSSTLNVCGDVPPSGWVTISVNGNCGYAGVTGYIGRTIKRIDSFPNGSTLNVCGDIPPSGWITISINGNCGYIGNTGYISRTIERVDSFPGGSKLNACGDDAPPSGWITVAINGRCGSIADKTYISRTIERFNTLPVGSTLTDCGDPTPSGWVVVSRNGSCGNVGQFLYDSSTIRRLN